MIERLGGRDLSHTASLGQLNSLAAGFCEEEVEGARLEVGRVEERFQILVRQLAAFQS
jgi:hypothetical protein